MSGQREITAKGIVVARRAAGEGSVRVSLYTDALGLVTALAKSAREERSKLRPHLQVGTLGTYRLVKGRDIWRVTGATDTENIYFELGENDSAQKAAARVIQAVRQFVRGEGSDPYLFSSLIGFFETLPHIDERALPEAECVAVLRMLAALGYVAEDETTRAFLAASYDGALLEKARGSHRALVTRINEGINASGL